MKRESCLCATATSSAAWRGVRGAAGGEAASSVASHDVQGAPGRSTASSAARRDVRGAAGRSTPSFAASLARGALVVVALAVVSLAAGCKKEAPAPAVQARDESPASARSPWVKARPPEGLSMLEAPAKVQAPPEAVGAVTAPFPGRVVKIHVRPGQTVAAGEPIADVAMVELVKAAAAYSAAGTRIAAHRKRKAQLDQLRADGLARLADLAEVEASLAEAQADQQAALGTLRAAGAGPGDAAAIVASGGALPLRSPVAGVVLEVNAAVGEGRDVGDEPIARVAGSGPVRIEARLAYAPPEGARFEVVPQGREPLAVKLVAASPIVEGADGAVRTWFEPETAVSLPHGAACRLRVLVGADAGVVAVPAKSVGLRAGKAIVVSRKADGPVEVTVLATSGADALVKGPLAPGDEIAAEAPLGAAEDAP